MYADDVLHLHHYTDTFMNRLAEVYMPDRYFGTNIEKVQLDDGSVAWSMPSREYVTN